MSADSLQAVLVDMDGTLVDTESLWFLAEQDTMAALGTTWTDVDQAHSLGGPLERVVDYMIEISGTALSSDEVAALLLDSIEGHLRSGDVDFTTGARELLDSLVEGGIPLALVSASPRRLVSVVLDRLGAEHFATTIAGDEVTASKPNPDPYLMAAERLGVDPHRCAVLEDSPTGVAAGLASGGVVIAIPHLVDIAPAPRLFVVDSLSEVTPAHVRDWVTSANAESSVSAADVDA